MTLLAVDGFDVRDGGPFTPSGSSSTNGPQTGRHGSALNLSGLLGSNDPLNGAAYRILDNAQKDDLLICGLSKKYDSSITALKNTMMFRSDGNTINNVVVIVEPDQTDINYLVARAYRSLGTNIATINDTLLGTSERFAGPGYAIGKTDWFYIEAKVRLSDSGSVEIRVNESVVMSLNNVDTRNSSAVASVLDAVAVNGGSDDAYVCNEQGSEHNDYIGDIRIDTLVPIGNGNSVQFTSSLGGATNYESVDDIVEGIGPPSVGSSANTIFQDYNYSSTVGHKDTLLARLYPSGLLYSTQVPSDYEVLAVSTMTVARKSDSGTRTMKHVVRSGGSESDGPEFSLTAVGDLSTAYPSGNWRDAHDHSIFTTKPGTSDLFSVADIDVLEIGYKVFS